MQFVEGPYPFTHGWCMGRGACVTLCPSGARELIRDECEGIPLDMTAMDRNVMEQTPRA
ncbi:MAG: hypothetical protein ISF22_04955 [Methanomassiliicoccus sp.]|nr:hypothetical protein [Methanomassiliicoccus sp.]